MEPFIGHLLWARLSQREAGGAGEMILSLWTYNLAGPMARASCVVGGSLCKAGLGLAISQLCDLGQVLSSLWTMVFLLAK